MKALRNELRQLIKDIVLEVMSEIKEEVKVETKAELEHKQELKSIAINRKEVVVKSGVFAMDKGLVTEKVVLELLASGNCQMRLAKSVVVTPLAKELMRSKAMHIVKV